MTRGRGLALAAGLLLALLPRAALAHAGLVASDPPPGSVQAGPASLVTLVFTQPVQPFGRGLEVTGPDGRRVDSGPVRSSGATLSVAVAASGAGSYRVSWAVIAADTHPSQGTFEFSVGHPSPLPLAAAPAGGLGAGLEAAARWLHFAGFALGFGAVFFAVFVLPAARLERLAAAGVVLLLAAEPLALVAQTASLGPASALDPAALQDALASPFGRLLGLRLAAALGLWALLGAVPLNPAGARYAILGLGAALAVADAAAAHAQVLLPGWLALLVNAVHVAAAAVWIGGAACAVYLKAGAAAFGRVALPAAAVLIAAGALLGLSEIGDAANLWRTGFGLALLAKTAAVGLLLLTAWRGRRRLELGAMALVLAVAGLLAALPTPAP